jgi:histidine triad (HIT) family protein
MECVFCKIARNELEHWKIYEDDKTIAFLDKYPLTKGHTLVATKKHYENLLDAPEEDLKALIVTVKKVAKAVCKTMKCDGFNIGQNNGAVAGQIVFHLHFHIVPRFKNDGLFKRAPEKKFEEKEMEIVAKKIKENLS